MPEFYTCSDKIGRLNFCSGEVLQPDYSGFLNCTAGGDQTSKLYGLLWHFGHFFCGVSFCFVAVRASSLGRAVALWRGVALWGVVAFWCVVAVALWRVVALGRVVGVLWRVVATIFASREYFSGVSWVCFGADKKY